MSCRGTILKLVDACLYILLTSTDIYYILGLGLGFRGAGVDHMHVNILEKAVGIYVRIGYRLSSLDMGTCARICRLIGHDSGSWRRHELN